MIFGRVKPLDAILATAEKKSLKRSLGGSREFDPEWNEGLPWMRSA